jgi:hypothetical protein
VNDNFLPANIAGFASETALVNGVRIHHWVGGNANGPPVLLWHGFLGTGYVWNNVKCPFLRRRATRLSLPICGATCAVIRQRRKTRTRDGRD